MLLSVIVNPPRKLATLPPHGHLGRSCIDHAPLLHHTPTCAQCGRCFEGVIINDRRAGSFSLLHLTSMSSAYKRLIPALVCLLHVAELVAGRVDTRPPPGDPYADPQNDPYNPLRYITSNALTGISFGILILCSLRVWSSLLTS